MLAIHDITERCTRTRKVLVVDDEPRILSAIEDLLQEEFSVLVAQSAEEGLEILQEEKDGVEVILCDQKMPGMKGDEFLGRARELSEATRVLITGYADLEALIRAVNYGQIYGYIAKPWDPLELQITVRKAAEHCELVRALRESEERFRNLFDGAPIGMALVSTEARFLRVNGALCRMLGYEVSELEQLGFGDVLHPEDRGWLRTVTDDVLSGKRDLVHAEKRMVAKSGEIIWVEVTAARVKDRLTFGLAMLVNITERKAAEEARQRLVQVLESTPDLVCIAEWSSGKPVYINQAGCSLLGIETWQDWGPRTLLDMHPREERERVRRALEHAAERGSWVGESTLLGSEGRKIPVSQVVVAHKDEKDEIAFVSSICRDTRELKALEEQARQSQKMEAVGRLAGGVAHDFNNLLTAIAGYAEILEPVVEKTPAALADLREIQKAAARAADLTQQLLAFSRRQVLKPEVLNLADVVADMRKMIRRLIGENIDVLVSTPADLGLVEADRGQMEQVILNLAVNARDAMPKGGSLHIAATNVEHFPESSHGDLPPGRYVMLSIRDTGIGMDEATCSRIFEPFFTTKEKGKGTGLGLSTVYGIVRQSGGHIEVESAPGKGSVFRIYLARVDGEPKPESNGEDP